MGKLISLLINRSHQRMMGLAIWSVVFIAAISGLLVYSMTRLTDAIEGEAAVTIEPTSRMWDNVTEAIKALKTTVTAAPCSPEFHEQMRQVAFLPDGLNEFLYAPDGVVRCSVNADFEGHALGQPSFMSDGRQFYARARLDFLGLVGTQATITLDGPFGVVVPATAEFLATRDWLKQEVVVQTPAGYFHSRGVEGLYARYQEAMPVGHLRYADGALYDISCDKAGLMCIVGEASIAVVVRNVWPTALLGVFLAAMMALGVSGQIHGWLRNFWSFESRFRRHFTTKNIICTYQPILSIESGQISGCEVLVRWRDVDGSVIFPDQFLPIIARRGLSRELTRMVVERAFAELSARVPPHLRLQVNFNIVPTDLDAVWLRDTLSVFEAEDERFRVVVEIVESDEIEIEHAAREIDMLRRYGIRTQLDDFGTGYSNIQNLASLPLDGVKLDRSFAMAEDDALMHRMMFSTIEMIHSAGHRLTVEGVENEARLRQLAATGHVQFAQGYHIARPLEIDRFVQLLGERSAASRPRLVA